ncbi:MAG: glycoside hydrolase family 3 C-terminal domain-containing protein [Lachnospiraceae bacterium]|nr:glycoside hydrolase family 3 C-terminal domain-containing protein [Lachnospiraceae bacterium]
MEQKLKMSNKTFRRIIIPIVVLLTLILILLDVGTKMMSSTIDTYLGKGGISVKTAKGTEDWDSDYYEVKYNSAEEATEAAYKVAAQVQQEGTVLLKNNGVLPLTSGDTVMPFGRAYLSPSYGQNTSSGSAKWVVDPVTPEDGLAAFNIDSTAADIMKSQADPVGIKAAEGTTSTVEETSALGGDKNIYEYDASIYDGISQVSDETAVIFITRGGQEGADMKHDAYEDGTPHYLALSVNEKETIRQAKRICKKVVVVLVSSATLELAPITSGELEVDAILWYGHPGERGFSQLSDILTGMVNPSGRTVDTYVSDLTADPSYQSIGVNTYSNVKSNMAGYMGDTYSEIDRTYNEYMEGVYMGYRYYETADLMDDSFVYGTLDGNGSVIENGAVIYPFGYGLSYTTFEQKITDFKINESDIQVDVQVTNTGNVAGKDVVQLYTSSPYTELDKEYKIEKPAAILADFTKTKELAPGESETVTLTFAKEDMASYCYTHENSNGTTGCYVLEAAEYVVSLRNNSHDVIEEKTLSIDDTLWYDGSDEAHTRSTDEVAATNLFQASSDYMNEETTLLSRNDWSNTQPQAAEGRVKELGEKYIELLGKESSFDVETDEKLGNVEGSIIYTDEEPVSEVGNNLVLSDLRGLDYDDPKWDELLDQIDWEGDKEGILLNFAGAAYATGRVDSIGLPETVEPDGANGLKVGGAGEGGYDMTASSSFGFAPLMSSTWNEDLLYDIGVAFGQESLQHGINGWYCPAINLHRSQFSGRIFEYYSEDPVLSGKLAARVISGAGDQGMFCYLKHFALNDTETGRALLVATWADEQTMRELYFRAFEIAIKEAESTIKYISDENGTVSEKTYKSATAVMAAQNSIGYELGEANYSLLTSLLRDEWGFNGMVVSDYWVWGPNNIRDYALRSGCDTYLCNYMPTAWSLIDYDSPTARSAMRNAIHNIAYTVVNSNAMQGVTPGSVIVRKTSPWQYLRLIINLVIILINVGLICLMVRRANDEKLHPNLYKQSKKKHKK